MYHLVDLLKKNTSRRRHNVNSACNYDLGLARLSVRCQRHIILYQHGCCCWGCLRRALIITDRVKNRRRKAYRRTLLAASFAPLTALLFSLSSTHMLCKCLVFLSALLISWPRVSMPTALLFYHAAAADVVSLVLYCMNPMYVGDCAPPTRIVRRERHRCRQHVQSVRQLRSAVSTSTRTCATRSLTIRPHSRARFLAQCR